MADPELEALREVSRADVYKGGELAATLARAEAGIEFRYLPSWIERNAEPVATALPVTSVPVVVGGGGLPAYFTGLLPEGRRLTALRRAVKTSADDELSLLLAVGADAVGDVQVVPASVPPRDVEPRLRVRSFDEVRFAELLVELGIRAERTALPGVQDKVSAAMLSLPVASRDKRFILKLNPPEFPHLVENEHFFLSAARVSGLTTPPARLVRDVEGMPGLLVERFDRVLVPSEGDPRPVTSLAVEDACQVLGRPPADKYVVGAEQALKALADVCLAPLPAARVLLMQLVFAYLTGNGDAHAKNFAVLRGLSGEWRPSPAYDLPSSYPYGDTTMALSMGGRVAQDYGPADFEQLGRHLGLRDQVVRTLIRHLVSRTPRWLPGMAEALPFDAGRTRKLRRFIEYRIARLAG